VEHAIYGLRHFPGARVGLGPRADAAPGLAAVAAVGARSPRLRNRTWSPSPGSRGRIWSWSSRFDASCIRAMGRRIRRAWLAAYGATA